MTDRRTPRAHLQNTAIGEEPESDFPVSPALVEQLDREFPMRLSPKGPADFIAQDQARLAGQQDVIQRLRILSNKE